jgi:DNA-binding phage protein
VLIFSAGQTADHHGNSAIAKRTGLSRNTVKKWLKAAGDVSPKYR